MLKLGIDPEKLYRATFIRQYGLCCCNMALVSFRLFCKNLGHLREFFGQTVYRPPWQKISRTPMATRNMKTKRGSSDRTTFKILRWITYNYLQVGGRGVLDMS